MDRFSASVSGSSSPGSAGLPPLIPRAVLFGNPEKSSPQISPDGRWLAYLAPDDRGVLNVWVRTLGQDDDRVVTADKKRGIHFFLWQGDSEHILYLQDQDGNEDFHLYQTDLKTKNTRDLTPWEGIRAQVIAGYHGFTQGPPRRRGRSPCHRQAARDHADGNYY